MYNNTNPAELYSATTWELLASDKYIRTGNTALQTGGSNSVSISKANLPNVKLKVDSFSISINNEASVNIGNGPNTAAGANEARSILGGKNSSYVKKPFVSISSSSGTASPSTEVLGSGTALTIQPSYITLKFWKRLS